MRDRRVVPRGTALSLAIALALLACALVAPDALALTIKEYAVPRSGAAPFAITLGPDGNLWFPERDGDQVGRVTPSGAFTEFQIPSACQTCPSPFAEGIAPGPDGRIWFTEVDANLIGRATTSGIINEFTVPTSNSHPFWITPGPDGRLWFTQDNEIGRVSTSGTFKEYGVPGGPTEITAGPDGNLWFTEWNADQIGRITTSGAVTEFPIPTTGAEPSGIAAGPDGDLWFTEFGGNQIGRITTSGTITEFPIPTPNSGPAEIASGPDGNLWFGEAVGNQIGRVTTSGTVTEFPIPTDQSDPEGIAAGPDGGMWFAETSGNNIGETVEPNLNILNVYYLPNLFVKKVAPLAGQGETVTWLMLNPGTHGVADATGMHIFGFGPSGGPMITPIGETVSFAFPWAGKFAYDDPFHAATKGTVAVPIAADPLVGAPGAQVTWAAAEAPSGDVFDVQVKVPGSTSFTDWRVGVGDLSGTFTTADPLWAGRGRYRFRARVRQPSSGAAAGYSAPVTVKISP